MDKLLNYICDELDDLERKVENGGKLAAAEIQYGDMLAHFKKNLLTAEAMMDSEYSNDDGSYARGRGSNAKRDSMGRYSSRGYSSRDGMTYRGSYDDMPRERSYDGYSRSKDHLMSQLQSMEQEAQDDETRHMVRKWIRQLEEQ